jgi:CheY-like chemotaxis protein
VRQFALYRDIKSSLSGDIPTTRQTRPSRPALPTDPVRVLLVEDHLYSRKLTTQILNRLGLNVAVAGNGLEAVEALRRELYDLVLMDIEMPVMDGLSAARTIRHSDSRIMDPDVPIIALTAHAYEEDRLMCLKAGMNDYLLKPIDPDALKSIIDRFVICDGQTHEEQPSI